VSGIAVHWYLDSAIPAKTLDVTHAKYPNKWIFGTEACAGAGPFAIHVLLGGYNRAENYAKDIIEDMNHWVTGWTDWNMALDPKGGPNWSNNFVEGPVIVNSTADEFYKQPIFYIMGHFSKFVLEGSQRIDLQVQDSIVNKKKVSYVAFDNQELNQITLVILNE
jgi:glucosylceramidase